MLLMRKWGVNEGMQRGMMRKEMIWCIVTVTILFVLVSSVDAAAPVADFSVDTNWGNATVTQFQFTDLSTIDPTDPAIDSWVWNWSDDSVFPPVWTTFCTDTDPTLILDKSGDYSINLTVGNDDGEDSESELVSPLKCCEESCD